MCEMFEMFLLITFNTFSEISVADLLDEQLPQVHCLLQLWLHHKQSCFPQSLACLSVVLDLQAFNSAIALIALSKPHCYLSPFYS